MAHTSTLDDSLNRPWHTEIFFRLRPVNVVNPEPFIHVNDQDVLLEDTTERLRMLYRNDSKCLACQAPLIECSCKDRNELDSDMTFHPTGLFRKILPNSDRSLVDRMFNFGRGGSPFVGFPVEHDKGCMSALLHLAYLCTPLFTGSNKHVAASDQETFFTLLQALGAASDRHVQRDIVQQLATKYSNGESDPSLQSSETPCPGEMLNQWLADAPQEYVHRYMGVEVEETRDSTPSNNTTVKQTIICIKGQESRPLVHGWERFSLEHIMNNSYEHKWSVKGDFFWIQIGPDSTKVFCEPDIEIGTQEYFLLGFISLEERDGKSLWVATIRNATNLFFVMDHNTCEPKRYYMDHLGPTSPHLLLYGTQRPKPATWLRTSQKSIETPCNNSDMQKLSQDGLVTGSVSDLLAKSKLENLQRGLQQDVTKLLQDLDKKRQENKTCQSAAKLSSVQGWPMPSENNLSLVFPDTFPASHSGGSTKFTSEFGKVSLQRSVTSPQVEGINLLVCSFLLRVCVFQVMSTY